MFLQSINSTYYPAGSPFPNCKFDGLLDSNLLERVVSNLPPRDRSGWVCYDNPLEKKAALNDRYGEPPALTELYRYLNGDEFVGFLRYMTDIPDLQPDPTLYGGGINVVDAGGKLDLHRDLEVHPVSRLERRLNVAVFLNKGWRDDWGGHLELWSERDGRPWACKRRIRPLFNRVVLFDPSGFHGFPDPLRCPPDVTRTSIQLFYYSPPRSESLTRTKALFAPRPSDPTDQELDKFRLTRAGVTV